MAIKITKKPISSFHAHCTRCGAEFTYTITDLAHTYVGAHDYVKCPGCDSKLSHPLQK